jgi:hypothetical protein
MTPIAQIRIFPLRRQFELTGVQAFFPSEDWLRLKKVSIRMLDVVAVKARFVHGKIRNSQSAIPNPKSRWPKQYHDRT